MYEYNKYGLSTRGLQKLSAAVFAVLKVSPKRISYRQKRKNGSRAGIFKQCMGPRNRVGIGLSYRPARLHRLAEFIPWNRFLGFKTFKNTGSDV
jgi:hypothetical protein